MTDLIESVNAAECEEIVQQQQHNKRLEKRPSEYPKSVAFIISNEFCERFNYYGLRTILVLYLTTKLHYDKDTATVLFHIFTMLVYLFPLVGAIIADSWLGKFRTILYLSMVYALGGVIVSLGAIPLLQLPVKEITILGLTLIALGTGGIKPCVSAFGGDQFRMPEQAKQLATFFSLFYFAINAGSTISTTITPILREDVHCFGDKNCFSLAFSVPAMLMLLSVVIFVAGRKLYVVKPPAGNMIFGVSKCISDAIGSWRRERKTNPRKHWLDYAEAKSGQKMVADTKVLLKILTLFLPFPVFWALFDQQGSRWTFQATRMNGEIFGYVIKPDQMQVVNPLLILGMIPLFTYVLYPILAKVGIKRPLQKLTLGGLLAAIAFLLSAALEVKLNEVDPAPLPELGANVRIYNGMPCAYRFTTELPNLSSAVEPLGLWENKALPVPKAVIYPFNATSADKRCKNFSGTFRLTPGKETSYFIYSDGVQEFIDSTGKTKLGNPTVRVLLNVPAEDSAFTLTDAVETAVPLILRNASQVVNVVHGESELKMADTKIATVNTKGGGVYALLVQGSLKDGYKSKTHVITPPNSIHMMWQLPQIIVITAAEIMFSVTGLEFSYTQAPPSMTSVLQACWLLSVSIGNMLVVVIAELKFFESQAAEFALFAGLMIVDMFIFILLTIPYKYVEHGEDPEANQVVVTPNNPKQREAERETYTGNRGNGHMNEAYEGER
ncbi:PREDICTED: peptide transporter family 1 isoform X1 [Bactrocera latifrons]|uniref:peptide transporter family 1 isoform X1 n=1 Tax=Bactrocera latifrons TaxID=174628 RepID=UPI0008DE3FCD|nr:PREDICTED: peptide transporter family 1 isoform X1 [Bactrocera latifrons]